MVDDPKRALSLMSCNGSCLWHYHTKDGRNHIQFGYQDGGRHANYFDRAAALLTEGDTIICHYSTQKERPGGMLLLVTSVDKIKGIVRTTVFD
jgi:hypothetical protein